MPAEPLHLALDRLASGLDPSRLRPVSRQMLAWNARPGAWMRPPQRAALTRWILLRELLPDAPLPEVARALGAQAPPEAPWPDPVFALAMGTGKTLLMASCLLWELLVAAWHPEDPRCARNALVLAPDRTVLDSLLAIRRFDRGRVLPPELRAPLERRLRFHALVEPGETLNTLDGSSFNVIIANVQKVALQSRRLAAPGPFEPAPDERALVANQRLHKLCRLPALAVFVDEAHHSLGRALERDLGLGPPGRLRESIHRLHEARPEGLKVCGNFTGTPYARGQVLPQVVYRHGLAEAVEGGLLKRLRVLSSSAPRGEDFVAWVLADFLAETEGLRPEGLRPKLAFFATGVEELEQVLRPALERALAARGIPLSEVLVNVGDPKLTRGEDLAAFRALDTPGCEKRFILLVNKGREGWDCRSLFGVALHRRPRSRIFVLQAALRCLRAVGEGQARGTAYVSASNAKVLSEELRQAHGLSLPELDVAARPRAPRAAPQRMPPPRTPVASTLQQRPLPDGLRLELRPGAAQVLEQELGGPAARRLAPAPRGPTGWSLYSLSALLAEATRRSPLELERALRRCAPGPEAVLEALEQDPELLWGALVPQLRRL
ncbi:MAG: DEAD/DEAH box helicase family protein [Alphaproteobacteria bacterium]|nr:DEAD/DEAH box helicase family protein [Alphaproteobacteria bacterium]MCB9758208.1 DEAD/DEAH box helicase family protein [Alphaproteobacteria bacterium]MCB9795115.1 DEAD/DEAH box helicase family protein [Alphaproteobacteria bacterium]